MAVFKFRPAVVYQATAIVLLVALGFQSQTVGDLSVTGTVSVGDYSIHGEEVSREAFPDIIGHGGPIYYRSFLNNVSPGPGRTFAGIFQIQSDAEQTFDQAGMPNDKAALYAAARATGKIGRHANMFAFNTLVENTSDAADGDLISQEVNVNNNKRDIIGPSDVLNPIGLSVIAGGLYRPKYAVYVGSSRLSNRWFGGIKFSNGVTDFGIDLSEIQANHAIILPNNRHIVAKRSDGSTQEIFSLDSNNDMVLNRSALVHGKVTGTIVGMGAGRFFDVRNRFNKSVFLVNESGNVDINAPVRLSGQNGSAGGMLYAENGKLFFRNDEGVITQLSQ